MSPGRGPGLDRRRRLPDTLVVEKAFDGLVDGFSTTVSDAVTRIVGTAEGLVDEDSGQLSMMLSELKGELTSQLAALFDPESKSSALARTEAVFADAAALQAKSVRALPDPANDKGPLGLWRAEVLGVVREQVGLVLTQLTEVAATVAATDAHAETFKLTAVKGQSFEDQLHPIIGMLALRPTGPRRPRRPPERRSRHQAWGRGGDHRRGRYRRALRRHRLRGQAPQARHAQDHGRARRGDGEPLGRSSCRSLRRVGPGTHRGALHVLRQQGDRGLDPETPSEQALELAYMWLVGRPARRSLSTARPSTSTGSKPSSAMRAGA